MNDKQRIKKKTRGKKKENEKKNDFKYTSTLRNVAKHLTNNFGRVSMFFCLISPECYLWQNEKKECLVKIESRLLNAFILTSRKCSLYCCFKRSFSFR